MNKRRPSVDAGLDSFFANTLETPAAPASPFEQKGDPMAQHRTATPPRSHHWVDPITDPYGGVIPLGEPMGVLRGVCPLAWKHFAAYADDLEAHSYDPAIVAGVRACAEKLRTFAQKRPLPKGNADD